MHEQHITKKELDDYPIKKIIRFQMFQNGDVEFPIEECINFVADTVFPRVQQIVQKSIDNLSKRKGTDLQIIDLVIQFKRNPKLLKKLFRYVRAINYSNRVRHVYDADSISVADDEYEPKIENNALADKVIAAIQQFDSSNELIDFVTNEREEEATTDKNRRIALRTAKMSVEKYQRFAEARSYSFVLVGGRSSELFDKGFRFYTKAPSSFNHDMLVILNFCAVEMLGALVENAFRIRMRELQGNTRDLHRLGPLQLEHYQAAANAIPSGVRTGVKRTHTGEPKNPSTMK